MDYSLTLHDESGDRLVGFDNAHPVQPTRGPVGKSRRRRVTNIACGPSGHTITAAPRHCWPTSGPRWCFNNEKSSRGKQRARRNDPQIWFTSMESFAKILSGRNRALLSLIADSRPGSLAELSELSGRAKSNLSRTLKTMERYGLVQLRKGHGSTIVPRVPYSGIILGVPIRPGRQGAKCADRLAL